ncbi:MAG: SDR family oxidoreductase [Propionibacteriaceae bacterium]|nr:SDR family oxidoreductase [Propionibacteriaceae bacterium]
MTRTSVVTGVASGIGMATANLLKARGERVIGVDLHDAEVNADLSTPDGLEQMVSAVTEVSGGAIDAIYAIAGVAHDTSLAVKVNYFGMTGTLIGLRPLLLSSSAPRAQAIASMASLNPVDQELVDDMLAGDRHAAIARADAVAGSNLIYGSTKQAFARWIRRNAATPDWAGASIPLNAVAPGVIRTPMTKDLISTDEATKELLQIVPMPLNGVAEPTVVAELLSWLGSPANTHLCGQVVFVDGGSDVVMRGDSTW